MTGLPSETSETATTMQVMEIRSVSGYGPRCGCGGRSTLHLRDTRSGWTVTPEADLFFCAQCIGTALDAFVQTRPSQPPYWPGDEDRDEPYVDPRIAGAV